MESTLTIQSPDVKGEESQTSKEKCLQNEVPAHLFQYLPFNLNSYKLQNICRLCLNNIENNSKVSLLSIHKNIMLMDMLRAFTSIHKWEMYPEGNLPSYICRTCQSDVIYCYQLKLKCDKSNSILQTLSNDQIIYTKGIIDTVRYEQLFIMKLKKINFIIDFTTEYLLYSEQESDMKIVNNFINDEVKEEISLEVIEEEYLDENELSIDNKALCIVQNAEHSDNEKLETTDTKNILDEVTSQKKSYDKQYTCNFCFKKFDKVKNLRAHVMKKHSSEEYSHPCDRCKEVFCSQHDLQVHSAVHTTGPLWACNKCNKAFKARSQLRRHIQRHMEAKRFSCESCDKSFSELYALRRHMRVHTGETLEKKYACHLCDKRYSEQNQLRGHVARHLGERRCVCACGKAFATARLLASHRLVHSEHKPYACSYCEKRFRHESTRNTHHRTHTGEKPYVCAACGKTFIQNSNLTLHMRTHTGERPYSCDKCDRKFATGSSLKNHQWRHTGEKPYGCTVCGKRFARQDMKVHMRQHTGERPHACSACPKRFVSASRLRDHCRIHTGEKPFECATCTHKFSTKSHLVKHLKKHQMKKKRDKREVVIVQKVNCNDSMFLSDQYIVTDGQINDVQIQQVAKQNVDNNDIAKKGVESNITLELTPEVPIEVTRELVVQDDCDVKEILVVDNSQNDANYQNGDICINTDRVNYVNSDVNLVTVNEGTTVKLYQLDQSLVQIHSSGGQVTISKITSKMTANF